MAAPDPDRESDPSVSEIAESLQRQPHLFMRLLQNSLTVAESLRDNYFKNTARFVSDLKRRMRTEKDAPILLCSRADILEWPTLQGEVVTFIDGGVGQVEISSQVPLLLRVGSYSVRTGERRLTERENFGYYPIILGDLQGGSKERKDFIDIVRITAELLGGLSALARTPDMRVLMFHGPLVYLVGSYAGHTPFTEKDIDLFLHQYAHDPEQGRRLKEDFLKEAELEVYPKMSARSDEWVKRKLFEPLSWMAFLFRRLISEAKKRDPHVLVAGVVERGTLRDFSERILLERVFRGLRQKGNVDYFNKMYARTELTSPKSLLDKLGYTDALLLAMLLQPGQWTESWQMDKYSGLRKGNVILPGESDARTVDFSPLKSGKFGFPGVSGCYVHVSETTEPIRVETFDDLGSDQVHQCACRTYRYARLLPGYGFPVGLDIVDKYAHVPEWMTGAYAKLIRLHLGMSLQKGEINDKEMRRILVQAIYMTNRDWLYRPEAQ
jgi:NurA domain-containing protein